MSGLNEPSSAAKNIVRQDAAEQIEAVLERLTSFHPKEIDLSLGRMERLLAALGHPEKRLPPTIHVAGTNGKGSVTGTLRAILEASGKRCHVYTSPHLVSFNERIRLGSTGQFVTDERLLAALQDCEAANDGEDITFFEITTAAAFLLFAEEPADLLLLEVGLGGRLDATNVIDAPLASVITPVSMDHENYLGSRLVDIAGEKAGIIKAACPVIVAPQEPDAEEVIRKTAASLKAPLQAYGEDFTAYADQGRLAYQDEEGLYDLPLPNLAGNHQITNAAVAIATLKAAGLWPGDEIAAKGLRNVNWPGRLQPLSSGPLVEKCPKNAEVWIDGGHNPGAGLKISAFMGEQEELRPRPLYLICAMLTTKDPVGFFRPFAGLARHVACVPITTTPNARDPFELADCARIAGLEATPFETLEDAIADVVACAKADGEPPRLLICGSLYLVGEVLAANDMAPE